MVPRPRHTTCACALRGGSRTWASAGTTGAISGHDGAHVFPLTLSTTPVLVICALDNARLAVGTASGQVAIHRTRERGDIAALERHYQHADHCAVLVITALSGGGLVSAGTGGTIVRLPSPDAPAEELEGHTSRVQSLLLLSTGLLASASRDTTVRLWPASKDPAVLRGHAAEVSALAELPDRTLASGSFDTTIRLWRVRDRSAACLAVLSGHTSAVVALVVLPTGVLASGGWCDVVRLWV